MGRGSLTGAEIETLPTGRLFNQWLSAEHFQEDHALLGAVHGSCTYHSVHCPLLDLPDMWEWAIGSQRMPFIEVGRACRFASECWQGAPMTAGQWSSQA